MGTVPLPAAVALQYTIHMEPGRGRSARFRIAWRPPDSLDRQS